MKETSEQRPEEGGKPRRSLGNQFSRKKEQQEQGPWNRSRPNLLVEQQGSSCGWYSVSEEETTKGHETEKQ